jgi:4-amino-4-deoxy-L-arabinose transferase-like glycosyltransferase
LLAVIFILAFALSIYHLSFFEFKSDQLHAISAGNDTRRAHFLITHGVASGVGVNNPPLFLWFMGILTFFTSSPFYITTVFMLANMLALALAICYFYITLPAVYAVISSILLAFSPAFITYAGIIWAQTLLPLLMVLFHISLYKLIQEESKGSYFVFLVILAALASQLHMSGFFLFPILIILGLLYRNKINKKTFAVSGFFAFAIFLPYLWHLFYEKELGNLISYFNVVRHKSVYWKLLREHLRMASTDFFRYYFKDDFFGVLGKSVGIFKFILYPLSCILIAFFAASLIYYLSWVIKGRKLFNASKEAPGEYPLPLQIAGFMLLFITLGYFVFRVRTPLHYFIILFPSYSLLTGFAAYKIWKIFWLKVIVSSAILSTIILLGGVLLFLRRAGGHPHEYGPDYQTLLNIGREVRSIAAEGYCPSLSVSCPGQEKCDKNAILSVVTAGYKCNNNEPVIPLELIISWDGHLMRYGHSLNTGDK